MPSTSDLLLQWDRQRARSRQVEIGWSEVGSCRRRTGYRLAGTPPTNPAGSVQAVLGTAVHDAIAAISRELGIIVETEVRYAGVLGHYDRREGTELIDVKTVGTDRWLEHIELHGPPLAHRFQVHGYSAALIQEGIVIRTVRIDYIARDTGREWSWRAKFDPEVLREALAWIRQVRDTELDDLPRDYLPDTPFCQNCPFFDPCWQNAVPERNLLSAIHVDDPDTARYAEELFGLRAQLKELTARERLLTGILDAVRPADLSLVVDAGGRTLKFRKTNKAGSYSLNFIAPSKVDRG
jgi:CRISPR/Cas system-associated exonuclease Cas4 (RecB family)